MSWVIKLYLLMLYYFHFCNTVKGEIILTEDKPYDVIDFKIPRSVWAQAIHPTPVLKSPVTVVVPVNVNEEDEINNDEALEDEVVDENEIQSPEVPVEPIVQNVANDTQAVTSATEAPVLADPTTLAPEVTGQVVRFPCSCPEGQCGCCTGAFLERFRMKACGNITFIPEDFMFDVRLTVNNNTVVRRRVSASDPPPICFNPRRAPFVEVCAEISNIRIRNRNAFACLDINANIGGFQIYSASFRCFGLGQSGVQTGLKPQPVKNKGPKPVSLYGNPDDDDDDRGSFLENVAGGILEGGDGDGILGGGEGGFFGGGGGDDDGDGPFAGIGEAVGDIFDGRKLRKLRSRV
ncbi:hypothetical protein NE865_07847 [Phthorimaea operculella]|nr:hypothetical protein NE865_07847 [Phthorimaea operculella]